MTDVRVAPKGTALPGPSMPSGTVITCTAGHEICATVATIHIEDVVQAAMFGPVRPGQRALRDGRRVGPCSCGMPFVRICQCVRTGAFFGVFHTAGGWMPPAPPPYATEEGA